MMMTSKHENNMMKIMYQNENENVMDLIDLLSEVVVFFERYFYH